MENCTIYSHKLDFEKVVEIVKTSLPKAKVEYNDGGKQKSLVATIKGGLFGKSKKLIINYRERENPSYKLENIECGLTQNLSGIVNFVGSIPARNKSLQSKFLHKVMAANCEMPFMAEPSISKEFETALSKIIMNLDAFVFAQPNGVFNRSNEQHFVDKSMSLILDTNGNSEIEDIDVVVDAQYHDESKENYTEDQLERKEASQKYLLTHGVKVNRNLPCISSIDATELRTKEEVIARAYALMIVSALGEGIEKDKLDRVIADKQVLNFSPKEQEMLDKESLSDQDKAHTTWRYESLNILLWALNIMPELKYPSDICDVPSIVSSMIKTTREEFEQRCNLRTKDEILNELDKIYRIHWSCVDARIKLQEVSGNINPSVVFERHYSLNWLTRYQGQDWDDVQTNT